MKVEENLSMFRATAILATLLWLVVGSVFVGAPASAQVPKVITPEQVAEVAILAAGSRPVLNQIRRNGIERGRVSRIGKDGRSEDTRYELRFVRGDKPEKDKVRIDNKTPQAEYSLIFGEGKIFGIINGSPFQPRAEATADFISQQAHSIDALLRYKENESKLASAGKDKHQGIDVHVSRPDRQSQSKDALLFERENLSRAVVGVRRYSARRVDAREIREAILRLPHRAEHLGAVSNSLNGRRQANRRNAHSHRHLWREDGRRAVPES